MLTTKNAFRAALAAILLAGAACGSVPTTQPVMPEPVSAPAAP